MACLNEVELFLGGKCAPEAQLDLFDEASKAWEETKEELSKKGIEVSVSLGSDKRPRPTC